MTERGSGILMHITSLPSPYGIGDLGPWAYRFADFLARGKQTFWQVLPLSPTVPLQGNSPYSSTSAFAGNPLIISPDLMVKDGFLSDRDVQPVPEFPAERVDYSAVIDYKAKLLDVAYLHFQKERDRSEYEGFIYQNSHWLEDFALFTALKAHFDGRVWSDWPKQVRDRDQETLNRFRELLRGRIDKERFIQFLIFKQWFSLKRYCNQKGIRIIGDIPIYVSYDSADVWGDPQIFKLDQDKRATYVAGVPPDYFSKTGQLWGNPVYDWDVCKGTGFKWWLRRMEHTLSLFDIVRIDHLRGLVAYWEVPAKEKTAINGRWVRVPSEDFFNAMLKHFPKFPIIAEDLGLITPDVKEVMKRYGFPGMKVLLFAFGEDDPKHPYLPHNYERNCVVYTGTHDNNTARGWFENAARPEDKKRLFDYIGRKVEPEEISWELIRLAMRSVAATTIFPMQDILGLGDEARMNRPGDLEGHWEWRLLPDQPNFRVADRLAAMTQTYGRV